MIFYYVGYPIISTMCASFDGVRVICAFVAHVHKILLNVFTKMVPINPEQGINENYPFPSMAKLANKALFICFPSASVCRVNSSCGFSYLYLSKFATI